MSGATSLLLRAGLVVSCIAAVACSKDQESGPTCGEGTILEGRSCVPVGVDVVSCGAGTVPVDGICVAASGADADGPGDTDGGASDVDEDIGTPADDVPVNDVGPDVADATGDAMDDDVGDSGPTDDALDQEVVDTDEPDFPSCLPNCLGRQCGDDECGGSCGSCADPALPICDETTGQCGAKCVPMCAGLTCGDDGCGGSCGACDAGATCAPHGRCVPSAWICGEAAYGGGDACDCGCGALDPDCEFDVLPIVGCGAFEVCSANGQCKSTVPSGWTCDKTKYDAFDACDCGCGAADPDCKFALTVTGCPLGGTCSSAGTCVECVPSCAGKSCGPDGCGGSCGSCDDPATGFCADGECVDPCSGPVVLECQTAECGSDGCGGSCGTCAAGDTCISGVCYAGPPGPDSCTGRCGKTAEGGCSCAASCTSDGTCCGDYAAKCTCTPKCSGKTCGADGCGGTCGSCAAPTPHCDSSGQCTDSCTPKCDGKVCGDDGCGGQCGTCASDHDCAANGRCVPNSWKCSPSTYGDGKDCDCGCGAGDPDCDLPAFVPYGCAPGMACTEAGVCSGPFCESDFDCGAAICTGLWPRTLSSYAGACGPSVPYGASPGTPCAVASQCASGVCLAGACRTHCAEDEDCDLGDTCLGLPVEDGLSGAVAGFTGVCVTIPGTASSCTSQAGCGDEESCVARVDAVTREARFICEARPELPKLGASCATNDCPDWQQCGVPTGGTPSQAVCTRPCPGGAADCTGGWKCVMRPLHSSGTKDLSDDPMVPLCLPN
jgi:hypothetical protein